MDYGALKGTYSFMMLCRWVLGLWEENQIGYVSNAGRYGYTITGQMKVITFFRSNFIPVP